MKILQVTGILFLLLSFPTFAGNANNGQPAAETPNLSDVGEKIKEEMEKQTQAIDRITDLTMDCEYDLMCIYKKAEELAKDDSNPVYKEFYKNLQSNIKNIEYEHQYCSTDDVKAVKKILAQCNREIFAEIKKSKELDDKNKIEEKSQACYFPQIEKLASEGNIFAQDIMAAFAKNKGDKEATDKWLKAIEEHKGKSEYDTFQKCKTTLK